MIVNVPGYGPVNFPDGMSEADLGAAIDELTGGGAPQTGASHAQVPAMASSHEGEAPYTPPRSGFQHFARGTTHGVLNVLDKLGLAPEQFRRENEAGAFQEDLDSVPGMVGSFLGESMVLAPVGAGAGALVRGAAGASRVARALPRTARLLTSQPVLAAVEGAVEGTVMGGEDNRAAGAATGGTLAAGVTAGTGLAGRAARGLVKMAPQAEKLWQRGIDLSLGQLAGTNSTLGRIEGASTGLPFIGPTLRKAREKGEAGFVADVIDTAVGQRVPRGKDVGEHLQNAYGTFDARYDPIRRETVPGAVVEQVPELAVNLSGKIPQSIKERVRAEARDALTVLDIPAPKDTGMVDQFGRPISYQPPTPDHSIGDLQHVRKYVREAGREARRDQNWDKMRLLKRTEKALTQTMDDNLSPDLRQALREADADYSNYMTVESAVNRAGMTGKFTPKQLAMDIRRKVGQRDFAQGRGGKLRELAELGDEVLPEPAHTGTRWATLAPLGAMGLGGWINPLSGALAATPYAMLLGAAKSNKAKKVLVGDTKVQKEVGALIDYLRTKHPLAVPTATAALGAEAADED